MPTPTFERSLQKVKRRAFANENFSNFLEDVLFSVLVPVNDDGLLDFIFLHLRLLAFKLNDIIKVGIETFVSRRIFSRFNSRIEHAEFGSINYAIISCTLLSRTLGLERRNRLVHHAQH